MLSRWTKTVAVLTLAAVVGLSGITMATGRGPMFRDEGEIEVEADVEALVSISVDSRPLRFEVNKIGETDSIVGTHLDKGAASVWVDANTQVRLSFEATPLAYVGDNSSDRLATLDALYWVGDQQNEFAAGVPLVMFLPYQEIVQELKVHGKVIVASLSGQPAGSYRGTITVTAMKAD